MIYLVKQDSGFDLKPKTEQLPNTIPVEDEVAKKLFYHELMWQNGELVENPEKINAEQEQQKQIKLSQITDLKQKLADTDYQAIKYAEGEMSAEEYAPIKAQRREWRKEINELEKELQ